MYVFCMLYFETTIAQLIFMPNFSASHGTANAVHTFVIEHALLERVFCQ